MKRALWWSATWVVSLGALTGCPVYPEEEYACVDDYDCPRSAYCEYDDYDVGRCVLTRPTSCFVPADCPLNHTCTRDQICRPGSCIFEENGCAPGFACTQSGGVWACVRPDAGAPLDAGSPLDASPAPDAGELADANTADVSDPPDAATDAAVPDAPVSDGATDARADAATRADAGRRDAGADAAR